MTRVFEGWQCIGCGKIDVDAPCIGICQDKRVSVVLTDDFKRLEARNKLLESIVRRMVLARPNPNAWERSYKSLQAEASELLSKFRC